MSNGKLRRRLERQRVHNRVQWKIDQAHRRGRELGRREGVQEGITRLQAAYTEPLMSGEHAHLPQLQGADGGLLPGTPDVLMVPVPPAVPTLLRGFIDEARGSVPLAYPHVDFRVVQYELQVNGGRIRWWGYVARGQYGDPHDALVDRLELLARNALAARVAYDQPWTLHERGMAEQVLRLLPQLRAGYSAQLRGTV